MKILLVEDDIPLAQGLITTLKKDGFTINHVNNGTLALSAIATNDHDMAILDLGLPDIDGFQVLTRIRARKQPLPVLILTARDGIEEKVKGLDLGADDYLVKPFDANELKARLRVIERRLGTAESSLIKIKNVCMDLAANKVLVDNNSITLAHKELKVLIDLMENAGRIRSKNQLENRLYEWGSEIASNAVEVHIHNLRKKLPDKFIQTIRGVGYTVDPD